MNKLFNHLLLLPLVDSHKLEWRLPFEKIIKIKTALNTSYKRKKIKVKELQSLIGLLNFACLVVCPGRTFLRRLIDLTKGITKPSFYIRLNREVYTLMHQVV